MTWALLLGIIIAVIGLHLLGFLNGYLFPLKRIAAFLGGGGLACFFLSLVLGKSSNKWLIRCGLITIIGLNLVAFAIAYCLTHYKVPGVFGVFPRPAHSRTPADIGLEFVTERIPLGKDKWLETWFIPAYYSRGTAILFTGQGGTKTNLLLSARAFYNLNYDTLLVDYQGVGGSSGHTTTIGAKEAKDVASALAYAQKLNPSQPIILYGISMGSAAILRAIAKEKIEPDGIIIEMPFVRLLDAVKVRLKYFNIPSFPVAELLVFWGSIQHGFNGFAYNPVDYAKQVNCPTLLMQGELDKWVTVGEIKELFNNLKGFKELVLVPEIGHYMLVNVVEDQWYYSVDKFLGNLTKH
jgi:alpha-beta hydrolase superfamily lysophospholipase